MAQSRKEVLRKSTQLKAKKRIGKAVFFSVAGALLIAALLYLFYWPALTIQKVVIQGNETIRAEELEAAAQAVLAGKYLHFFPRRSSLVYPRHGVIEALTHLYPRLQKIEVGLSDFTILQIDVTERQSSLVWCRQGSVDRDCYFSDDEGFIFAPSPLFSGLVFPEIYADLPVDPMGTRPLSMTDFQLVAAMEKSLNHRFSLAGWPQFSLEKTSVIATGEYEATIRTAATSSPSDWILKFNNQSPVEVSLANLSTVLTSEAFKKDYAQEKGGLAYLDLRFTPKVFYKFKGVN